MGVLLAFIGYFLYRHYHPELSRLLRMPEWPKYARLIWLSFVDVSSSWFENTLLVLNLEKHGNNSRSQHYPASPY
jgi:hypothetical protein